jgi:ribosome biogenesis GTPase
MLPNGALLIDTPGMRELQLWADDESLEKSFEDIETLTTRCRFADCNHQAEPGCAVQAALADGSLDPERLESYHKQRKELKFLALKQDLKAKKQFEKANGKRFAAMLKDVKRRKPNLR